MAGREVRGRIAVHVRGFGFLEVDSEESALTGFITPPDLNPFFDGDRVAAHLEESDDGRFSATRLRLIERARTRLFGTLVTHGRRPFLRVDRTVANTDWPLQLAPDDPLLTAANPVYLSAELRGDQLVPLRRVPPSEAGLERVVVRHGLR